MAARRRFAARLRPSGRGAGGHVVDVPNEVVQALGGKGRTPVRATFDGVPSRGSIVKMGGAFALGVTKAIMTEAGVAAGDSLDIVVERDDESREVEPPEELSTALRRHAKARAVWDSLSYSHKREYAGFVAEAKRPDTRERRVGRTIEMLLEWGARKRR